MYYTFTPRPTTFILTLSRPVRFIAILSFHQYFH
jgi:hypothetical protein